MIGRVNKIAQSGQDPLISKTKIFLTFLNSVGAGNEICWEVTESEFDDIPKFVAEFSVPDHSFDVKIDRALNHVAKQCEPERVSSTFRYTLREVFLLLYNSLFNLIFRQVRFVQLLQQSVEFAAVHHLQGINHVTL